MGPLKSLAQGVLAAAGLIWTFNIASLYISGNVWLALLYLLILLIPATSLTYLKLKSKKQNQPAVETATKLRSLLFSIQGVALAFWMFDILTTFYAINITGLAIELNPLGWPLGILGAFAYYAPTLVFSYFMLFKTKDTLSLYGAVPLTLVTLGMGTMNLMAGAQNFQVFVDTAALATGIRYGLLAAVGTACLTVPFALKKATTKPLSALKAK